MDTEILDFGAFFERYGNRLFEAYPEAKTQGGTKETFSQWVLNEYDYYLNTCTEYEVPYTD